MSVVYNPTVDTIEPHPPVGGAVKPSGVLGSIAGIAGGASALSPATAVITAPIAAVASIGSAIAKLFGGNLSHKELEMIMEIQKRVDHRKKNKN